MDGQGVDLDADAQTREPSENSQLAPNATTILRCCSANTNSNLRFYQPGIDRDRPLPWKQWRSKQANKGTETKVEKGAGCSKGFALILLQGRIRTHADTRAHPHVRKLVSRRLSISRLH